MELGQIEKTAEYISQESMVSDHLGSLLKEALV
jgi:hypothetical protein